MFVGCLSNFRKERERLCIRRASDAHKWKWSTAVCEHWDSVCLLKVKHMLCMRLYTCGIHVTVTYTHTGGSRCMFVCCCLGLYNSLTRQPMLHTLHIYVTTFNRLALWCRLTLDVVASWTKITSQKCRVALCNAMQKCRRERNHSLLDRCSIRFTVYCVSHAHHIVYSFRSLYCWKTFIDCNHEDL